MYNFEVPLLAGSVDDPRRFENIDESLMGHFLYKSSLWCITYDVKCRTRVFRCVVESSEILFLLFVKKIIFESLNIKDHL